MKNDILVGELMEEEVQFCKHPIQQQQQQQRG